MYRQDLAKTLDIIASDSGAWDLYNGSLAQRMLEDLQDIGKLLWNASFCCILISLFSSVENLLHSNLADILQLSVDILCR